ncbi:hypothetical protein D3C81_1527160 [compost metagenome]
MRQQLSGFATDRHQPFHACFDGAVECVVHRFALFPKVQLRLQGHAHAFGGIGGIVCRRNKTVDQGQMGDAIRQGTGDDQRRDGTHGVPQQRKPLQSKLFGDLQHIVGIVPHGIACPSGSMPGMTVTGHVQGNDAQTFELGRQAGKAVGVVQPAVQGNDR